MTIKKRLKRIAWISLPSFNPMRSRGADFSKAKELMKRIILSSSTARTILRYGAITILCVFLLSCVGVQTSPTTSRARTRDLLNIHESIAPIVPIKFGSAKLVFFGDLHRGMGERDYFKDNKELFFQILSYYFEKQFSLVLVGDIEEGWGFQADNIPIILQWHKNSYNLEKKFASEGRYYRIFGNHDDYYRGNPAGYGTDILSPVYPAIIFEDVENKVKIFVTHGCQGHGLHDAGDQVASWGVFARYNWLLEILPEKKHEGSFANSTKKTKADFEKHEQYLCDWANEKNYSVLIAGHTHRPIYDSYGVTYFYKMLKRDIDNRKFPLYTYYSDPKESATAGIALRGKAIKTTEISDKLRNKMVKDLVEEELTIESTPLVRAALVRRDGIPTRYFNPGCGYLSEIPCIEINNGQIYHKYFLLGSTGKLEWQVYDPLRKSVVSEKSN